MGADFTGMSTQADLAITDILHKAFILLDESGTEAAAATAVIVGETSVPTADVVLTIDRPFLFFIRDNPTGSILFAGRVLDPTAEVKAAPTSTEPHQSRGGSVTSAPRRCICDTSICSDSAPPRYTHREQLK